MTRDAAEQRLSLTLFINGISPVSAEVVRGLRDLCERHCPSGYDLVVVDIHQQPDLVVSRGVVAVPSLFRDHPLPVHVVVGDMHDQTRVLTALGLSTAVDAAQRVPDVPGQGRAEED
jgi:circadian clock protein KaiB